LRIGPERLVEDRDAHAEPVERLASSLGTLFRWRRITVSTAAVAASAVQRAASNVFKLYDGFCPRALECGGAAPRAPPGTGAALSGQMAVDTAATGEVREAVDVIVVDFMALECEERAWLPN
jgi:hypothetical protein